MIKSSTFLSLFAFIYVVHGQGLKLAEVTYAVYPETTINEAIGDAQIGFSEFGIGVNIPLVFNEQKTIVLNGLNYGLVRPTFSNVIRATNEDNLHLIGYSLTLIQQLKNKWQILASFNPSISSRLEGSLSGDDFLYLGSAVLGKRINDDKRWSVGVVFTSRFGEPLALPLFEYYHKGKKIVFHAFLPQKIEGLFYNEKARLEYGLRGAINGSQFNLATTDAALYDNILFSRVNLGPVVNYGISDHLYISLFTGISANRRYDLASDTQADIDFSSETGLFGSFSVFVR